MQIQPWFIQKQNSTISIAAIGIGGKGDMERKKPPKSTAPLIKIYLDGIGLVWIGNESIEMWTIEVKAHRQ